MEVFDKENIIKDLYNGLEKLRYPEVAQINYEEFEASILVGNKRVELLNWLLQENQNFNSGLLNKFKEPSLEGKLLKCYSQMGFCDSEDILLGKCNIDKQLHFLSLLSLFIKKIYAAESESQKCDQENANSLIKTDIVIDSPSVGCTDLEKNKAGNENSKSLKLASSNERKSNLENMCCSIKSILQESNKHQNDNYESRLEKFYMSFKNVTNLPCENANRSSHDLSTDIEQIHKTFSTINKALTNQLELKNLPLLAENDDEKMAMPLSLVIGNNVVLIERACNMLKENKM